MRKVNKDKKTILLGAAALLFSTFLLLAYLSYGPGGTATDSCTVDAAAPHGDMLLDVFSRTFISSVRLH